MKVKRLQQFVKRFKVEKIPLNQVAVLLHVHENPNCEQKDMVKPLGMSKQIICNCMIILIGEGFVDQKRKTGEGNNRKSQKVTELGKKVVVSLCMD
jgi:predicted transcriptional regulator